jgi:hypothetical protein
MTQHHPYRSNTQKSGNPFPKARLLLHVAVMVVLLMAATGKSLQAADILVGGVLNTNTTWTGQNTYIVIETIEVPTGITLNIEAGANILFNRTTGLRVEGGRLIATGNANDSIFMLPNHHPGDNWYWQGLTVNGITNQNFVRLSHARIAHATTGITGNAADFVVLERNSIDNNLLAGIVINNGSSWQITYNQVINNINGLEILANNPDSQATDNHIRDNHFKNLETNIRLESGSFSPISDNIIEYNLLEFAENGIVMLSTSQGIAMNNLVQYNIIFQHGSNNSGFGLQCSMNNSTITNNIFFSNRTALELNAANLNIENNSFHDNGQDLLIREGASNVTLQHNTFSAAGNNVVSFLSVDGVVFAGNTISGNTGLTGSVQNLTPVDVSIAGNFWDTVQHEIIEEMLYDGNDDPALGFFAYEPFLPVPSLPAPMSPPLRVFAQHVRDEAANTNKTRIWWRGNKEENLEGYRVYFGDFADFSFTGVVDSILTDTVIHLPHLESSGIGVTALDESWNTDQAQLLGHESVYGMATFLPWAGDDASICATQALYNIQHSTAPFNNGLLNWSSNGDGAFSNPSILRPVYFPGNGDRENGQVRLTLTLTQPEGSLSDSFVLNIWPKPTVDAGPDVIITPEEAFESTFASASNYHHILWESSGDGVFTDASSLLTRYFPGDNDIAVGKAILTLTASSDFCGSVTASMNVLIKNAFSVSGRLHTGSLMPANHPVIATRLNDPPAYPKRTLTFTDDNGAFSFDALFEGDYVFYAPSDTLHQQLHVSAYHPTYTYWQDAFVHKLNSDIFGLDVRMEPLKHLLPMGEGSISGQFAVGSISIFDAGTHCVPWFGESEHGDCEQGLSNVSIFLLGDSEQVIYRHTLTDFFGRFSFRELPFGQYVLKAEMAGYTAETSSIIELTPEDPSVGGIDLHFTNDQVIAFNIPESSKVTATGIHIYPNPVKSQLFVDIEQLDRSQPVDLSIYNSMGRLVMKERWLSGAAEIHATVDHLHGGLYVLRLQVGSRVFTKAFVKTP